LPDNKLSKNEQFVNETDFVGKDLQIVPKSGTVEPKKGTRAPELLKKPVKEKTIGLNKKEIERIRRDTELDKLDEAERKTWERTLGEAKKGRYEETALETADEVLKSKRPITDTEHAGMVLRAAKLADEYDAAVKDATSLIDKGDKAGAKLARQRSEFLIEQLDKLTEATKRGRREAARSLSIGRMMLNRESYSLAHVVQRAKAAKGAPLSPKESARIESMVAEHTKLETQLKELETKYEASLAEQERLYAERIATRETKKAKIRVKVKGAKERILAERADIKKQIAAMGYRVNDITGVTAEGAYWIGKLAVNYIKEGVVTLDGVVKKVMTDIPGLTERDVYRSLISKNPRLQKKARRAAAKQINQLKTQARLLLDIEKAEKGVFEPPAKKPPAPQQIKDLQKKLKDLRSEAYRSVLEPGKLERAIQKINELQDQLENHYRTVRKKRPVESEKLLDAQKKMKEIRSAMRVEDELAKFNEQMRTGEFEIKSKPQPKKLPPDLEKKQIELKVARRNIRQTIDEMQPWTGRRVFGEAVNTARTLKATADFSGTLRQGLVLSIRRPITATTTFGKAFKAFFNSHKAEQIDNAIRSSENYYLYEKSGLQLTELSGKPTMKEEMFGANVIEKIPVLGHIIKASNRHMTTTLNLLRTASFDQFLTKYPNATHAELRAIANWINVATGRGDLGKASTFANELSLGIFAPRFAVSRIQTPFMVFKHWKNPRVRAEIAKDMVALVSFGGTCLTLGHMAGFEVGLNPRNADFGKIKIGNTRVDIWGGFIQPARVITRLGMAATDRVGLTGEGLRDYQKTFDPFNLFFQFASYKAAPSFSIPRELLTGKTAVYEPTTPTETAVRAIMPMVYEDIYEAYKEAGAPRALWSGGLNFLGVSTNTYQNKKAKKKSTSDNQGPKAPSPPSAPKGPGR